MIVKYLKTQIDFIRTVGNPVITKNGDRFYYIPFWFKIGAGSKYDAEMFSFVHLPEELREAINEARDVNTAFHYTEDYRTGCCNYAGVTVLHGKRLECPACSRDIAMEISLYRETINV